MLLGAKTCQIQAGRATEGQIRVAFSDVNVTAFPHNRLALTRAVAVGLTQWKELDQYLMASLNFKSENNRNGHRKPLNLKGLALAFALLALSPASAIAQESDTVVGTFSGEEITIGDLDIVIRELGDQLGQVPQDQKRIAAMLALIDIKLLAEKATEDNLDDDIALQRQIRFLRDRALHNALFEDQVVGLVSEEEVRARYDKEVAATPAENELRASHILVETEEEAIAIIAQLDEGADFAELAKEKSTGPSGPNGGDLGFFTKGRMVAEFEEAVFALDVGSYTKEPVKTQFGYHVILSVDLRPVQPPAYEQVQQQIRSVVLREKYYELLQSLRAQADVQIQDPVFKEAYDAAIAGAAPQ